MQISLAIFLSLTYRLHFYSYYRLVTRTAEPKFKVP